MGIRQPEEGTGRSYAVVPATVQYSRCPLEHHLSRGVTGTGDFGPVRSCSIGDVEWVSRYIETLLRLLIVGESTSKNAPSSIQFINLTSGGQKDIWKATQEGVRLVRQLVHCSLEGASPFIEPPCDGGKNLYLQRRVFTKVRRAWRRCIKCLISGHCR